MRTALCLSGHFRSYERTFETLQKSIIGPFNPDVFISTEENLGYNNGIGGDRGDRHLIKTPLDISKIEKLYNPKKIIVEPRQKWEINKYINRLGPGSHGAEQMFGMFYGVYKSNQLKIDYEKENNFIYDIVIRCRPDIYFDSILDIQKINGICFPKFGNYSGLNDQFAFGDSHSMNLYSKLYENLDMHFDSGCLWHPETMLKYNINYYNIPIHRTDIKFRILRANGGFFINVCEPHNGDIK
jgi:hypothetical protein